MSEADFARKLDAAGLWNHLAEHEREEARNAVATGGWPLETIGQDGWFADGEELAEGGVETFLLEPAPSLAAIGVELNVETISGSEASTEYAVRINGRLVDLMATDDPWTECTLKPLAVVNELLADAGRRERVAVLYPGGNEGIAYRCPSMRFAFSSNPHSSIRATDQSRPSRPVTFKLGAPRERSSYGSGEFCGRDIGRQLLGGLFDLDEAVSVVVLFGDYF